MRTSNLLLLGSVTIGTLPSIGSNPEVDGKSKRPNIIYIMSDDHAFQAISAYDHPLGKIAPTPNIDRIASSGMLFDNAYCANSISGPSRACVMTGKHSHANGFMSNNEDEFDGSQLTLPKVLGANGYKTAIVGKWHLGSNPTGFDFWSIHVDQGEYNNPRFIEMGDTTKRVGYATDLTADYGLEWIDKQKDGDAPFFLMLHFKAPHRNWIPAERHYQLFENTVFPEPETLFDDYSTRGKATEMQMMTIDRHMFAGYDLKLSNGPNSDTWINDGIAPSFGNMTDEEKARYVATYRDGNNKFYADKPQGDDLVRWKYQRYMRDYCATIAAIDENVGRVLDYLKANGLDENTIVVYTSDQGFYLGEHGWYDKRFMYEESMRMPLMMMYPKAIAAHGETTKLVQNIDFAPTLIDFAGAKIPTEMQGESFKSLLTGGKYDRKSLYYRYYETKKDLHNVMKHLGVKQERYKLICFFDNTKADSYHYWELYDLQNDPRELNNIYGKVGMEKITKSLKGEIIRLAAQYNDILPAFIKK